MLDFARTFEALQSKTDNFSGLRKTLSKEIVEAAISLRGQAKVRHRKLPPDTTLWLLVGLGLFRNKSLVNCAETLNLWVDGAPAASSLCAARKRLGVEPLKYLFKRLGEVWSEECEDLKWKGLRLYAIDGTHLDIADSLENSDHFGRPGSKKGTIAGYPQARVVAKMNLLSRYIVDAEISPLAQHERTGAERIIAETEGSSLTILDRGFQGFRSFCSLTDQSENRHFLARVKKNFKYRFVKQLSGSSFLAEVHPSSKEDVNDPTLPSKLLVRVIECQIEGSKEPMMLVTSLLDEETFPALELAELYHLRWEIELAFKELKAFLLEGREALRSQSPDGVQQEIFGIFVAYNLVRREMLMTAREHAGSASSISFVLAMQFVHNFFSFASLRSASPGTFPKELQRSRDLLWKLRLPDRRSKRSCSRWVKRKMSKFPKKPAKGPRGPSDA